MSEQVIGPSQAEINEAILADTRFDRFLVYFKNQKFLLSISPTEEGALKLWVQFVKAIRIDDDVPIENHDRLVFGYGLDKRTDSFQMALIERRGFPEIMRGEEIGFLEQILTQGVLSGVEK